MPHGIDRRIELAWFGPLLVAAFAFLLFSPSIAGGYTLDDNQALLGHPAIVGDVPVWEVFVREYWGRAVAGGEWSSSYRPLSSLTFALEHRITDAPWVHHLGNVLWFAALCATVTRVARRWCSARAAVGTGLFFAALPIHVESVASIVGRADVIASLLAVLAAHLALADDGEPPGVRRIATSTLLYLAALLAKETVALLPGLVAMLVVADLRARSLSWTPRRLASTIALCLAGLGYLLVRHSLLSVALPSDFVPADNLLVLRGGWSRAWGNLAILGHYVELTVVPVRLCSDHTYAEVIPPLSFVSAEAARAWLGVIVSIAIVRDAWRAWAGRSPGLWCATGVAFLLVGQWVISLSVILAERLALWPSIWLAFALGDLATRSAAARSDRTRPTLRLGLVVLLGLLAARSVQRTLDWRDDLTLHRAAVEVCPRAVHSRFILANLERDAGHVQEAVWHFAVAGAGRSAFPGPFHVPALDVEQSMPLNARLRRLPELVGASDRAAYWARFHEYLVREGHFAEARLVASLAAEDP